MRARARARAAALSVSDASQRPFWFVAVFVFFAHPLSARARLRPPFNLVFLAARHERQLASPGMAAAVRFQAQARDQLTYYLPPFCRTSLGRPPFNNKISAGRANKYEGEGGRSEVRASLMKATLARPLEHLKNVRARKSNLRSPSPHLSVKALRAPFGSFQSLALSF